MTIFELQEPPEGHTYIEESLVTFQRQFDNGTMTADSYHRNMASSYGFLKIPDKARYHAAQVSPTAYSQELSENHATLARLLVFEKNIPAAILEYQKALEHCSDHDVALEELAYCLMEEERYEEAIEQFELYFKEIDYMEDPWREYGKALAALERYPEAIEAFKKAMALINLEYGKPDYDHYFIGLCYQKMNNNYMALAHYTYALQANPDMFHAKINLAALYATDDDDLHDIAKSIAFLKEAELVAEEENNKDSLQLIFINLARLYKRIAEFELHRLYQGKLLEIVGFPPGFIDMLEDYDGTTPEDDDE